MATTLGQIATELARTNPWWRVPAWSATDIDLRAVRARSLGYRSPCLDDLARGGLFLLRGPRRVGKTVVVKQTIERLVDSGTPATAIVRVDADGWSARDLRTVVQNSALPPVPPGQHRWWFLDEITAVNGDWAQQVKWLRDNDPGFADATVVLTGSGAQQLTVASGVLAGRRGGIAHADRTLLPVGFRTFATLLDPELPQPDRVGLMQLRDRRTAAAYQALLPWLDSLLRLWELYLAYGGFPVSVAAARDGAAVPQYFVNDMFDIVFRDAFASSQLSTTTTTALVERVMVAMAAPLSMRNIAADLDLSAESIRRHVSYLRDAYLVWHCPQKEPKSWTPRERAQDKVYAVDPLVARLAHLRNQERADIDPTVLTEMQIGSAIHRAAQTSGEPDEEDEFLFHARTPARKEIDFVARNMGGVAVEGKYSDSGRWARAAATVDASPWDGVLATRSVLDTRAAATAWAVPAAFLCFMLDT